MASGGRHPVVAVAVRPGGSGSRLAARWVAEAVPCDGRATAIAVVHVIPPLSFVPSPTGERVPVAMVGREAAKAYARDRRARAEEELLPFLRLCGRGNVKVKAAVVEGNDVGEALLRYAQDYGVRNLVLGSVSCRWFPRALSNPNVPGSVLQATQNSCNVFVVSKRKVIMKLAGYPQTRESNTNLRINTISHEAFARTHKSLLFDDFTDDEAYSDSCTQPCSSHSASNIVSSSESCIQVAQRYPSSDTTGTEENKSYDALSSVGDAPYSASNSSQGYQSIDEVEKLRKELRDALVTYDKACGDLVHFKKKIQVLSTECSKEARKVVDAQGWEEALKRVVTSDKGKHLDAMYEVEQGRSSFTHQEAYRTHNAETASSFVSLGNKEKVVDTILSTGSRCRWYSRREIELATDNFSEARKIGEGGYGNVYRGTLDHTEVAVKVLQHDPIDKTDEFLKEIEILSQLRHPNLVVLLGFCPEMGCLVYEYLKNGSLEDQLFNNNNKNTGRRQPLHWYLRLQIIFEVCCGLAFLHAREPEPVVHGDLKPGNILLDENYVAKIGDAGFAKLAPDGYKDTVVVAGAGATLHYMDPEYRQTGTVRPESDVFALGVVILQLLTGSRHPNGLITGVEKAIGDGRLRDVLDQSQLAGWPVAAAEAFAELGLRCTALRCRDRPDLESEVLPKIDEILRKITFTVNLRNPKLGVPSHFICPITQELMEDPHVASDGHTYERYAIKAWHRRHETSPVTRRELPSLSVIPNRSLRAAIQQWESHAAVVRSERGMK